MDEIKEARDWMWQQECRYISEVMDKGAQVREMNYDKGTFTRYCEMQKASAEREGFFDAAEYIGHVLDDLSA